jgi:hypothetical protein
VQALAHGSLRRPSGGLPKLSMSAPVASVAVRRVRGKLGASRLNGSCSAYTSGDQLSPAGCPSRTPSHHGTNRSVPLESPGSTHELISPLTCAYVVRRLAVVERVFVRPGRCVASRLGRYLPRTDCRVTNWVTTGSTARTFSHTSTD